MRAWARACDPNRDVGDERDIVTWAAAYHARPRGRHYRVEDATAHASRYAGPVSADHLALVLPGQGPRQWVLVSPDAFLGGYVVNRWEGEECVETYSWPNPDRAAEYIRGVYEARGYRPIHDWRT